MKNKNQQNQNQQNQNQQNQNQQNQNQQQIDFAKLIAGLTPEQIANLKSLLKTTKKDDPKQNILNKILSEISQETAAQLSELGLEIKVIKAGNMPVKIEVKKDGVIDTFEKLSDAMKAIGLHNRINNPKFNPNLKKSLKEKNIAVKITYANGTVEQY